MLISPHTGLPLRIESEFALTDGERRYPMVEGIPFLRMNREELAADVLRLLERGARREGVQLLLQDQDDWSRQAMPQADALDCVIAGRLNLREAMQALNFGAVGDYFAYRWSDPTFLSGLALLDAHLPRGARVFELACGIGHYLREFELRGVPAVGADVVFAKLWLARHYLAPGATLICCDAGFRFPVKDGGVDSVFCQDAFYFLPEKEHVLAEMRRISSDGAILIGHTHCAEGRNFSAGEPLNIAEYAALLPGAALYDDSELTRSVIENRAPERGTPAAPQAIALAMGECGDYEFQMPVSGLKLRLNPLFGPDLRWPSERYRNEYAELSSYLLVDPLPAVPDEASIRKRIFVALPERW